jgi:hypothetical protein
MPRSRCLDPSVLSFKSDQRDALACENAVLTHIGQFGKKEAHELATKMAKTTEEASS